MNNGVIIIAHNSDDVDYVKMSLISAELAKKNLNVPVSLITDIETIETKTSVSRSLITNTFENVILTEKDHTDNKRVLFKKGKHHSVSFLNSNRNKVFDLTPYDRTLLIDSDFLIFSNELSKYWNIDQSFLISSRMTDLSGGKGGILDTVVAPQSIQLFWATTVMFTKNEESENFFNLVEHIKQNYTFYSQLYQFNVKQYRNDISFSIAYHILSGFTKSADTDYFLPPIRTVSGKDEIFSYDTNALKLFLFNNLSQTHDKLISIKNVDIHFMNKFELLEKMELFQ